jgi:ankyrin repeat protein
MRTPGFHHCVSALVASLVLAAPDLAATDIFKAAYAGDAAAVEQLLDSQPALIRAKSLDKRQPLHFAVSGGSTATVELLLARGAVVDCPDMFGLTPLHVAAVRGRTEIAMLLLNRGAAINHRNRYGKTPLGAALSLNVKSLVAVLSRHGGRE